MYDKQYVIFSGFRDNKSNDSTKLAAKASSDISERQVFEINQLYTLW